MNAARDTRAARAQVGELLLPGLLERRIQILVVPLEDVATGAGGQHGPDRRGRAGRARQDLRLPGMRRGHRQLSVGRRFAQHKCVGRQAAAMGAPRFPRTVKRKCYLWND
jgi:hypothetical protein